MKKRVNKKIDSLLAGAGGASADIEFAAALARAQEDEAKKRAGTHDTKYQYSHVSMSMVSKNIEEYIIPELQEACKQLWAKNIFTFMVSNRNDAGEAYIMVSTLSDENQKIFEDLMKGGTKGYCKDGYRAAVLPNQR